jgi:WD40 repeat protein
MDIWDLTAQQIVTQFPFDVRGSEVVRFTPDGNYIVVAGYDGTQVWNLAEDVEVGLDNPLYGNVQALTRLLQQHGDITFCSDRTFTN